MPVEHALEGLFTGEVKDYQGDIAVPDVDRDEGAEPFLPGSVPELEFDWLVVDAGVLGEEVDSDGALALQVEGVEDETVQNAALSY